MKLLVVEDNVRLGRLLAEYLTDAGYLVDFVGTVGEAREIVSYCSHALYIIDLGLPDGDGLEIVKALRAMKRQAPILVVTARAAIDDRVKNLENGADDYLVKPFHHAEMLARVRALLRRRSELAPNRLMVGKIAFDPATGEVSCSGRRVDLRPSEQRLLATLIRRHGRLVSKAAITTELQVIGREASLNAVEQVVSRLRRILGENEVGLQIKTVRGIGYVLETVDGTRMG